MADEEKPNVFAEELQSVTKITFGELISVIGDEPNIVHPCREVFLTVNHKHHYKAIVSAFISDNKQVIALYTNRRDAFIKIDAPPQNPQPPEPMRA